MSINYLGKTYTFRSQGLLAFLRFLVGKHPNPVCYADLQLRFTGLTPRQIARYIDAIEAHDGLLGVVTYRTKTRGPFHLNAESTALQFKKPAIQTPMTVASSRVQHQVESATLSQCLSPAWVDWVRGLLLATLGLNRLHNSDQVDAFGFLDMATIAAEQLPPWAGFIVMNCRAHHLERESRYREAHYILRKITSAASDGFVKPSILSRAHLCRAKIQYDQGRYQDSEKTLMSLANDSYSAPPAWLNVHALNLGQKFNQSKAAPPEQEAHLSEILSTFLEAIGDTFMLYGDSRTLDALSFNFGNNLLRAIRKKLLPDSHVQTVLDWFVLNLLICNRMAIGNDSIYTHLLIVDVLEEFSVNVERLPIELRDLAQSRAKRENYLKKNLSLARISGNRPEIAECLLRIGKITLNTEFAHSCFKEACEIASELAHKNLTQRILIAINLRTD
ncbi:hypothetical protein [Undibacterium sp.]|uniref:hypothetical protein n=1 Tax=Undibacterium sp. TaxID=1914977 RepID=UPI003751D785